MIWLFVTFYYLICLSMETIIHTGQYNKLILKDLLVIMLFCWVSIPYRLLEIVIIKGSILLNSAIWIKK